MKLINSMEGIIKGSQQVMPKCHQIVCVYSVGDQEKENPNSALKLLCNPSKEET